MKRMEIIGDIDILVHEILKSGFVDISRAISQIKEMLCLAYDKRYDTYCNTASLENKSAFVKEHGSNLYIFHFSKLTRKVFENMLKLEDDEYADLFEYLCYKNNEGRGDGSVASLEVNELATKILQEHEGSTVLDLCAGNGLFLNKIGKSRQGLFLHGYEINAMKAHFANEFIKMNKFLGRVEEKDVLTSEMKDKHDMVFAEFPIGLKNEFTVTYESELIKPNTGKKVSTNWNFVYKILNSMKEDGVAITVVPNGSLFRIPEEPCRKTIVEKGLLEGVINLTIGAINGLSLETALLVFSAHKEYVTFIDASDKYESLSKRDKRISTDEIFDMWQSRHSICPVKGIKNVSIEEITANDYYLDVNRYIPKGDEIKLKNARLLKDYAELVPGFQYTTKNYIEKEHGEGSVNVIKISNIIDNEIDYDSTASIEADFNKVERFILRNNDILVATKGTTVKAAMFKEKAGETYISQSNVTVIRITDYGVSPDYLLAYINGKTGRKLLEKLQKGIAISSISMKDLENFEVPVVDEVLQYDLGCRYENLKEEKRQLLARIESIDNEISSVCEDFIKA